jgi:hypothetical protein
VVNLVSGLALWAVLGTLGPADPSDGAGRAPSAGVGAARGALAKEGLPWYDAKEDRVVPVLPWDGLRFAWVERLGAWISRRLDAVAQWFRGLNRWRLPGLGRVGDLIAIGLAMLLITLVLVALIELLRRYRPLVGDEPTKAGAARAGSAQRIEGLPAGVRLDADDLWAEAQRLRARGDLAGAVVHLFAHQLLALVRLDQVRLVPGRTARQLVRGVGDRQVRGLVEPTLRLFEAVYYGRHTPSPEAFEAVWAGALAFERRLAAEAGR